VPFQPFRGLARTWPIHAVRHTALDRHSASHVGTARRAADGRPGPECGRVTAAIHSSTRVPDTPVESFVSSDLARPLGWQGGRPLLRATALCYLCMRPWQNLWGHTGGEVPPQKADGPCSG